MADAKEKRRKRHHELLDQLHDRPNVPEGQFHALKELMKADPAYKKPIDLVPLNEATIRTEYALKIQKDIQRQVKDFRLNNVHLALFAYAPLSIFESGGTLGDANTPRIVHQYLETFPPLVKHFLARWSDKAYNKHLTSHPDTPAVPSTTLKATRGSTRESSAKAQEKMREQFQQLALGDSEEDEIEDEEDTANVSFFLDEERGRNSSAVSACKKRDSNRCVLTGASDPEVCHIVPFSWNSTRANIKKTQCVYSASILLMKSKWTSDNSLLLENSDAPGGSDHVWNTICMNPLLHKWWAQAFFGLKCLGIAPTDKGTSIVEVQFQWMPRSKKNPTAPCILTENDMRLMVDEIKALTDGGDLPVTPKHPHGKVGTSQVNLRSGYTFRVEMSPEDAGRFKDMLDLQWACIVIAALSGAARYPHLLPDHPRWGDPDIRTLAWVEEQMLEEEHAGQPPNS